jgi:hypothetical protein
MTTDAPRSALERYLIALLAAAYLTAWWGFGSRAAARSAAALPPLAPAARSVWYQELPPSERPAVQLPAGWHLADRVSRLPARAGRIRTRSS